MKVNPIMKAVKQLVMYLVLLSYTSLSALTLEEKVDSLYKMYSASYSVNEAVKVTAEVLTLAKDVNKTTWNNKKALENLEKKNEK